jgi:Family of unknown function (DUF6178)
MPKSRSLLDRLLKTPDLVNIVPRLQPEVLHRVIQTCGLEDCAELVALATPGQLARILDVDIWRVRTPGGDETFDADRFAVWIAVLMQSGAAARTEQLVGLDIELVIAGVTRHAAVFDHAAVSSYTTLDGQNVPGRTMRRGLVAEIGGYVIEAKETSGFEAMLDLLACLDAEHPEYFHRLMRRCVRLSNGRREEDGLHDLLEEQDQDLFDLAGDREVRREQQGFVAPAQAHAFLHGARDVQFDAHRPPRSAVARAYFRAIESMPPNETYTPDERGRVSTGGDAASRREPPGVIEILQDAGVLTSPPRALLGAADGQTSGLALIRAYVASDPMCGEELAYLANTIVAGCSIQGRPFTAREASDGAVAVCNLGLENWPSHWSDRDLVTAFQVGWTILHRDVCMYAARCLIDVLAGIHCTDRDIQLRLDGLRRELVQRVRDREPWRARTALDVIIMLDAPSWAALLTLIDECPAIHAALSASRDRCRSISPTDFAFISENSEIVAVREFIASLPSVLAC